MRFSAPLPCPQALSSLWDAQPATSSGLLALSSSHSQQSLGTCPLTLPPWTSRGLLRKRSLLGICHPPIHLAHSYSSFLTHLRKLPSEKAFPAPKFGANSSPVPCSPCSASFVRCHLFAAISSTRLEAPDMSLFLHSS